MVDLASSQTVGLVSHSLAAIAYVVLAVLLMFNWQRSRIGGCLVAACLLTALWAVVKALASEEIPLALYAVVPLETVRTASWILFMTVLLREGRSRGEQGWLLTWFAPGMMALAAILLLAEIADATVQYRIGSPTISMPTIAGHLMLAIGGLLLIENLYRNVVSEARWGVKFLCLGLGAMFVYDLYLYANGFLFHSLDDWLLEARGVTNAVIVPLLAVSVARTPEWKVDLFVSRRLAFYSATLIASGAYLVFMAMAGYYLRRFGGTWGGLLQVSILFGGGLVLLILLSSGRVRTQLRVFINKHFFNYRYDYRDEWLRFIGTISARDRGDNMRERAIQAVADIVDSPGGLLLLRDGSGQEFSVAATWNLPDSASMREPADSKFIGFLKRTEWIVDVDELEREPERYEGVALPDWVGEVRHVWLVMPLIHHGELLGLLVLQEARAPRTLNWEDHDILKTVGRQVASYLAEQAAVRSLVEARQFEAFNRRFAFILHDIKNLVSQLSLMTANAQKHAGNPEFQRDMLLTVQESVTKMQALLQRLHGAASQQATAQTDAVKVLKDVVTHKTRAGADIALATAAQSIVVRGEGSQLANVFEHVIQNALDATAEAGKAVPVEVDMIEHGDRAEIIIADQGKGMDSDFVKTQLFKPFRTTKSGGYGIGAYESREIVRECGGRFDVYSTPGTGTRVVINLYKTGAADAAASHLELEER